MCGHVLRGVLLCVGVISGEMLIRDGLVKNVSQVYYHVGVNISFYTVVTVAHNLLPHLAFSNLGTDGSPLLRAECVLTLFRTELDYRIQNGKVKTPNLDPCCPRGFGDWCRRKSLVFWVRRCNKR